MKANQVKKLLDVTQPTLSGYVKQGLIRVNKINSHHYIYNEDDVYKMIGLKKEKRDKINVSYSRVSDENESSLKEQNNRIYNWCISNNIKLEKKFGEFGSGVDFDRNLFKQLVESVIRGEIELVVIENKDRLIRFGFEFLEFVFRYFGTKILVINDSFDNGEYENERIEDLIVILKSFSNDLNPDNKKLKDFIKELSEK